MEVPTVEQWFTKKNIFITGGTGFIGKLLIEKLMRSCPEVGNIYLLIRPKRNKSAEERHAELIQNEIFTYTGFNYEFSKLILIPADLSISGLALKDEDIQTLHSQVNIVFHVAASIKFNEPFGDAIKINTRITRDIIELAKGMKHLDVFVHVSTAYVNCDRHYIEEKVYPPKMDWRKAITLAETCDSEEIEAVAEVAYGELPNAYTFSKNLAEQVVWEHRDQLPILIHRPVIVISTKNEPEPGWSDNLSGPEIILLAIGKGVIRVVNGNGKKMDNYCPVDITVNGIIAATWKMGCHAKITNEPCDQVVNSNYIERCPDQSVELGREMIKDEPLPDILWTDYYLPVENTYLFYILHLLINALPAAIFQLLIKLAINRDVPLTKSVRKYYVMVAILFTYFSDKSFKMEYKNLDKTVAALCEDDKEKFNTVILKENENLVDHAKKSIRRMLHLLGERPISPKEGFRHQRRMYLIDQFCRIVLLATALYFFPYSTVYDTSCNFLNSIFTIFVQ